MQTSTLLSKYSFDSPEKQSAEKASSRGKAATAVGRWQAQLRRGAGPLAADRLSAAPPPLEDGESGTGGSAGSSAGRRIRTNCAAALASRQLGRRRRCPGRRLAVAAPSTRAQASRRYGKGIGGLGEGTGGRIGTGQSSYVGHLSGIHFCHRIGRNSENPDRYPLKI